MNNKLHYDYQLGQDCINETLSNYPNTKSYYDYVARTLGCEISQLALLLVNPSFNDTDEEGWNIESFFPVRSHIEVTVITTNYNCPPDGQCNGFTFGEVLQVVFDDEKFVADHNASPFGVWAKYEEVEQNSDEV